MEMGLIGLYADVSNPSPTIESLEDRKGALDLGAYRGDEFVADLLPVRQLGDVLVASMEDAIFHTSQFERLSPRFLFISLIGVNGLLIAT